MVLPANRVRFVPSLTKHLYGIHLMSPSNFSLRRSVNVCNLRWKDKLKKLKKLFFRIEEMLLCVH